MEPWDRQPGESVRAYEAFCAYRDLGANRSLAKTEKTLKKHITTIKDWSVKYHWVERAQAYDDYLAEKRRIENEKELEKMWQNQLNFALGLKGKLSLKLRDGDISEIRWQDIPELWELAEKLEREARGLPDRPIKMEIKSEVHHIAENIAADDEARQLLLELYRRATQRGADTRGAD